jgi:hypothetical protein
MRRPIRIQAKARWNNDEPSEPASPPPPLPGLLYKLMAAVGMLVFWLLYFGVVGRGDHAAVETGFLVFVLLQAPMVWAWIRHYRHKRLTGE